MSPPFEKHMTSSPTTAALTLSLTGRLARQGAEAAEGVRLWAETAGIRLTLVDDAGSAATAAEAYAQWVDSVDLLLGPYSSGLTTNAVRSPTPLAARRSPRCAATIMTCSGRRPRRFTAVR